MLKGCVIWSDKGDICKAWKKDSEIFAPQSFTCFKLDTHKNLERKVHPNASS